MTNLIRQVYYYRNFEFSEKSSDYTVEFVSATN